MSITTRTREKAAQAIQPHALGRGLTLAQVCKLYPAKAVRRTSILEALLELEEMGHVRWQGDRVRWVGPLEVDRVFGEDVQRIHQDQNTSPASRGSITAELSSRLVQTASR